MRRRKWNTERAKELRNQGLTYKEITKIINLEEGSSPNSLIPMSVVYCFLNPDKARKRADKQKQLQRSLKQKNVDYKGGCCQICGYKESLGALSFHHIKRKDKSFSIANARQINWELIKKELDKCALLCANCHSEVHDGKHVEPMEAFLNEYLENIRPFLTQSDLAKNDELEGRSKVTPRIRIHNGEAIQEVRRQYKDCQLNEAGTAFCEPKNKKTPTVIDVLKGVNGQTLFEEDGWKNTDQNPVQSHTILQGELWEDISYQNNQHEKILR